MKDNQIFARVVSRKDTTEIEKIINEVNGKLPKYKRINSFEVIDEYSRFKG